MNKALTSDDVLGVLSGECLDLGTQKAWATKHGVSPAYVNDVIQGRREPGEKILKALGLEKVVTYVPSKAPSRPKPTHSGER